MPRILIVDDETIFRKGLTRMIQDMGEEWTVAGEAKDGLDALEALERLKPDVLLTDIRMPRMDGVQLQRLVREKFPHIPCIVLSGYDDFSFVQESLRLGAADYITKPVDREQLQFALGKAAQALELEMARRTESRRPEAEDRLLKRELGTQMLSRLLHGDLQLKEWDWMRNVGLSSDAPGYLVLSIRLDKESVAPDRYTRADPSLFRLYIRQTVQELLELREGGYAFTLPDGEVAAVVQLGTAEAGPERIRETGESIRRQVSSMSRITVTVGAGGTVRHPSELHRSYREAQVAALYRLIRGGNRTLVYGEDTAGGPAVCADDSELLTALEQTVYEGRSGDVPEAVRQLIDTWCGTSAAPEAIQQKLCKMLIRQYEQAIERELAQEWLEGKEMKEVLFGLCSISSRTELTDACSLLLSRLARCCKAAGVKSESHPVLDSIAYINRHYADNLSLGLLAERFYMNPSYFSSLFKSKTGKTFVEYVTHVRMEEAKKRLLLGSAKVQAIAEETGFENVRHFNRVFKQQTGLTPKEYRERMKEA